jgi:hypothetical protein
VCAGVLSFYFRLPVLFAGFGFLSSKLYGVYSTFRPILSSLRLCVDYTLLSRCLDDHTRPLHYPEPGSPIKKGPSPSCPN